MAVLDWTQLFQSSGLHAAVTQQPDHRILRSAKEKIMLNPPLGEAFAVNSEPHIGALSSVRLCVGLIISMYMCAVF
jgi:hypothetical protein